MILWNLHPSEEYRLAKALINGHEELVLQRAWKGMDRETGAYGCQWHTMETVQEWTK